MGKRGRKKQKTERIQITLYIDNEIDKEIYEHIMSGMSNSATARNLLIDGWTKKEQIKRVKISYEENPVINNGIKFDEETKSEVIVTYDEAFNDLEEEDEEENSFQGFLM